MRSAFGVEHGEFAKALKPEHRKALNKQPYHASSGPGAYARNRLGAHYQSHNRKIPGSGFKETGKAMKELAGEHARQAGQVGRLVRRLP